MAWKCPVSTLDRLTEHIWLCSLRRSRHNVLRPHLVTTCTGALGDRIYKRQLHYLKERRQYVPVRVTRSRRDGIEQSWFIAPFDLRKCDVCLVSWPDWIQNPLQPLGHGADCGFGATVDRPGGHSARTFERYSDPVPFDSGRHGNHGNFLGIQTVEVDPNRRVVAAVGQRRNLVPEGPLCPLNNVLHHLRHFRRTITLAKCYDSLSARSASSYLSVQIAHHDPRNPHVRCDLFQDVAVGKPANKEALVRETDALLDNFRGVNSPPTRAHTSNIAPVRHTSHESD